MAVFIYLDLYFAWNEPLNLSFAHNFIIFVPSWLKSSVVPSLSITSIGKLPPLSIFIDEVHHAVKDEIKLRAVVNKWAKNNTINSVIGFSYALFAENGKNICFRKAVCCHH